MYFYEFIRYSGDLLSGGQVRPFNEVYGQFTREHFSVILCALAILPLVIWDVLKMTHRIAGPLVRFQNCLRLLIAGTPVREVKLRKDDLLIELQQVFNEYLASLQPADPGSPPAVAAAAANSETSSSKFDEEVDAIAQKLRAIQASLNELDEHDAPQLAERSI